MINSKTPWLTAFMVLAMVVPTLATTLTFRQGESGYSSSVDSFVRRDTAARTQWNSGGAADITVQSSGGAVPTKQGMIKYLDIFGAGAGQIPAGQMITDAKLRLKLRTDLLGGTTATLFASPLLIDIPDYGTSDGPASVGEVSWKYREQSVTGWGTLGTELVNGPVKDEDYDSAAEVAQSYGKTVGTIVEIDITSIVSDWYTGASDNYGLLLRPDTNGFTGSFFHSNDFATVADRPQLEITFQEIPEPASVVILGLGVLATLVLRRRGQAPLPSAENRNRLRNGGAGFFKGADVVRGERSIRERISSHIGYMLWRRSHRRLRCR